jgi:hypothetical protein
MITIPAEKRKRLVFHSLKLLFHKIKLPGRGGVLAKGVLAMEVISEASYLIIH